MRVLVIGSGIFGATAALELRARRCEVTLVDPGPIPHPLAESTDISKVVRCDYGADEPYTVLGERSLEGWRRWNAAWPLPRFHETGVAFVAREVMRPGTFEHDSFDLLGRRGHQIERLDGAAIAHRFPAYRFGAYVDGYFHHQGGWAEASAVVAQLLADAITAGVIVRSHVTIDRLVEGAARSGSETLRADAIVVCAGAWTADLVPELAGSLRPIAQPVFHLRPADPSLFEPSRFPVFGADISRTGYYGFPVNRDGIVKIANHGTGIAQSPDDPRLVTAEQARSLRKLLEHSFPTLAGAPIVHGRLCVYCDSLDGHFWIARHPDRPALTVAAGGSGHAFKFAPVLGTLIADTVLGESHPLADRFRWRPELSLHATRPVRDGDAARST